jgi:Protein of unknown function (DUF3086)
MNPDGTANHESADGIPSPPPPQSNRPQEIIDVLVVEDEVVAKPLADIWDGEEVSATPQPPAINKSLGTDRIPMSEDVVAPTVSSDDPPTLTNDWDILLNEISQDLEPEAELPRFGKAEATPTNRATATTSSAPFLGEAGDIQAEIDRLHQIQARLEQQIAATQLSFGEIVRSSIHDLEQRRQKLQVSVEQLERRRDRIKEEISKSFAGNSQDIAIRLQGFKDYLVGSLQDLVVIAEEIDFPQPPPAQIRIQTPANAPPANESRSIDRTPQFSEPSFQSTATQVRAAIDRYRSAPDYYAPAWELRRTLEAVHADKVSDWFFTSGGRGAIRTMGSRLQNILVAATAVSVLRELYGEHLRTVVLANLPERLGDWRRGFQDCLGLSKSDFGGNGGIILFEDPEALVQRVDRIVADRGMPLIVIDNSEGQIALSILQYPLWLAFAPEPDRAIDDYRDYR